MRGPVDERSTDIEWSDSFAHQSSTARSGDDVEDATEVWPAETIDREEQATDHADALAYARFLGPGAERYFGTADAESTAAALLRHRPSARPGPLAEESTRNLFSKLQKKRYEEYNRALPDQQVPGLKASFYASTGLFGVWMVAAAVAAIRVIGALFSDDPLPESEQMIPGFHGTAAFETLLIAPVVLIPLYLVFHLTVLWRARTHGRAVLRIAAEDRKARTMGLPLESPFQGIWASWSFLLKCLEGLFLLTAGVAGFALLLNDDAPALSVERFEPLMTVSPLAWACLAVTIATCIVVWWREKVAKRRRELLITQLYEGD